MDMSFMDFIIGELLRVDDNCNGNCSKCDKNTDRINDDKYATVLAAKIGYDMQEIGKILVDMSLATQTYNRELENREKRISALRDKLNKLMETGCSADFMNDLSGLRETPSMSRVYSILDEYNNFCDRVKEDGTTDMNIEGFMISCVTSLFVAMMDEFRNNKVYSDNLMFPSTFLKHDFEILSRNRELKSQELKAMGNKLRNTNNKGGQYEQGTNKTTKDK